MTEAEYVALLRVAAENGGQLASVIREAVNEYVGDYDDRRVLVGRAA